MNDDISLEGPYKLLRDEHITIPRIQTCGVSHFWSLTGHDSGHESWQISAPLTA
jgi:hypothetical protein